MVGKTTFLLGWPIFRGFAVSFKSVDCWFPKIKTYWVFTAVSRWKMCFLRRLPIMWVCQTRVSTAKGGRFHEVFLGLSETFMGFFQVLKPSPCPSLLFLPYTVHGSVEKMGSPPSGSFLWFRVKIALPSLLGIFVEVSPQTPTVVNSGGWELPLPELPGWQTCQVQWLYAWRGGGGSLGWQDEDERKSYVFCKDDWSEYINIFGKYNSSVGIWNAKLIWISYHFWDASKPSRSNSI